jgi:NitT/TauT family transport system permease protein
MSNGSQAPMPKSSLHNQEKKRVLWKRALVWLIYLSIYQILYWLVDQDILLASPWQIISSLIRLIQEPAFYLAAGATLLRIAIGFGAGLLIGSVLAVLTIRSSIAEAFFMPLIRTIRATPITSFIILALVWIRSSNVPIFIVFLMVLPIVWANLAEGIRQVDKDLLEMAHSFRLSRGRMLRLIYIPSIAPYFMSATVTSLGMAWKAGISAEVLSTPVQSLGGRIYLSKIYLETPDLFALTIVVILLSLFLEKSYIYLVQKISEHYHLPVFIPNRIIMTEKSRKEA